MVTLFTALPLDLNLLVSISNSHVKLPGATAQNSTAIANFPNSVPGNPVAMPATNLNIGMDLWNASSAAPGAMKMRPSHGVPSAVAPGMVNDQWIQV